MAENNEQVTVQAEARMGRGKNDSRRMRAAGLVPITIYGGEGEAISATAKLSDLAAIIRSHSGINSVFKVTVDGTESEVMFHDRQIDPLRGRLTHADLKRIVRGQKMNVTVSLELMGDPLGVTEDGGVLDQVLHTVEVRCRPSQIPESITADVSHLRINEALHISDIKTDDDIEFVTDPKAVVATVKFARPEEEEAAPAADAAAPVVSGEEASE